MILGRRGYSVVGGKYGAPRLIPLHRWRWPAFALCLVVLLNPVFLPYAALFNAAFSPVASTLLTVHNFTLQNINFVLFELSAASLALKNTVILGTATATIGTAIAVAIAYVTARQMVAGWRVLGFPGHRADRHSGHRARRRPVPELYAAAFRALRHVVDPADRLRHHCAALGLSAMQAAFRTIHPELEDASRILGATRLRSLWQITAPLLRTGVIATWCFVFVGVMRELSAAIILFTSETKVVSVLIYDLNESGDLGAISVIGLGMLLITFAVVIAVNRIPGFGTVRFRT